MNSFQSQVCSNILFLKLKIILFSLFKGNVDGEKFDLQESESLKSDNNEEIELLIGKFFLQLSDNFLKFISTKKKINRSTKFF